MSFGYVGDTSTSIKQQVKNAGVLSVTDVLDLEGKGQLGGSLELIAENSFTTSSAIDILSIKENKYDNHFLQLIDIVGSTNNNLRIQYYENDVLETASVYQKAEQFGNASGTFGEGRTTGTSSMAVLNTNASSSGSAYIYFYNLGNSSKYSYHTMHSITSDNMEFQFGGGVLPQASLVNGIRFVSSTGTLTGSYKLYGLKIYIVPAPQSLSFTTLYAVCQNSELPVSFISAKAPPALITNPACS